MKVIIAMRTDLNMRKGKMVAQGGHAIHLLVASYHNTLATYSYQTSDRYKKWMDGPFTKICVGIENEQAFVELIQKCDVAKIPTFPVTDAGKTEFNGVPTLTCCAIGPATNEELEPITGHLKLL